MSPGSCPSCGLGNCRTRKHCQCNRALLDTYCGGRCPCQSSRPRQAKCIRCGRTKPLPWPKLPKPKPSIVLPVCGRTCDGRHVYDARWAFYRACCGQPKPQPGCKDPALHRAFNEMDLQWLQHSRMYQENPNR